MHREKKLTVGIRPNSKIESFIYILPSGIIKQTQCGIAKPTRLESNTSNAYCHVLRVAQEEKQQT